MVALMVSFNLAKAKTRRIWTQTTSNESSECVTRIEVLHKLLPL